MTAAGAILDLLREHVGQPCPTNRDIADRTALGFDTVKYLVWQMQMTGKIRSESRSSNSRRLAILVDGRWQWTDWTEPKSTVQNYERSQRIDDRQEARAAALMAGQSFEDDPRAVRANRTGRPPARSSGYVPTQSSAAS